MARQFQGYARGRGFSSRGPGAGAVNRIQEQGNKTISGLRQQLQSKRQRDQQFAADLDSNFRREQAIQAEIKSFEDKAFDLKMSNIRQNQQQSLENIRTEASNSARQFEQLAEFSSTLGQSVVDVKNAVDEAKKKAEFATITLPLTEPPTKSDLEAEEQVFKANATLESNLNKVVTEDGMPRSTFEVQKAASPYKKIKSVDNRIALAEQEVSTATYDNYGPEFIKGILDKYDLYDVRPSRLYGLAQKYAKTRSAYDEAKRKRIAIDTSTQNVNTAFAQLINNPIKDNFRNYLQTLSTSTEDGRVSLTREQWLTTGFKALENLNFTNEQIESFMDMEMFDENGNGIGETYRDRFGKTRYQTLINNREKARVDQVNAQNNNLKAEQLDNYLKVDAELDRQAELGPVDFNSFKMEIDDVSMSQDQRNKTLEKLFDMSTQGFFNRPLIAEIERLRSNGQDYTEAAKQLKGPDRYKYLNLASQEIKERKEAGIDDKAIRRTVKSALVKALGQQNVGDDKDPTLELAIEDALIDIGKDSVINAPGSSLADASKLALQQKLKEIQSGTGKYEVKGIGKGKGNSTSNYFSYFTPDGEYFTQVVKANASQAISAVRQRPESRKDVFLTTTDDLGTIYNAIQNGEGYQLPYALQQIQKAYPDSVQLQLNKYADEFGKPRITVPLTQNQFLAARENDPRVKQFALRMDTIQEEKIIPIVADPSARSHPRFKTDAVNQRISFMQVAPADGGLKGLTVQDYQELAYAVSAEAQRGTDDEFAVAASILNRLASGRYGSTVAEVIRAPGQYEAVYKGMARYEPELAQRLASPDGQRMIVAMLQKLQGRTDFKGQTQLGNRDASDPMFSDRGNFYHYAGQSAGSGTYQGPIDTSYERFIN